MSGRWSAFPLPPPILWQRPSVSVSPHTLHNAATTGSNTRHSFSLWPPTKKHTAICCTRPWYCHMKNVSQNGKPVCENTIPVTFIRYLCFWPYNALCPEEWLHRSRDAGLHTSLPIAGSLVCHSISNILVSPPIR